MKEPAHKYIKRKIDLVSMPVRVDADLKCQADEASEKLNTSLNRFVEAALRWYLEQLKKEGSL